MIELILPHQAPIRFAKYVISKDEDRALVKNEFATVPTLGMLIEAVAQSSATFAAQEDKGNDGFLATLRNVKLLTKPSSLEFNITIIRTQQVQKVGYFSFEVNQDEVLIATGSFMVIIS